MGTRVDADRPADSIGMFADRTAVQRVCDTPTRGTAFEGATLREPPRCAHAHARGTDKAPSRGGCELPTPLERSARAAGGPQRASCHMRVRYCCFFWFCWGPVSTRVRREVCSASMSLSLASRRRRQESAVSGERSSPIRPVLVLQLVLVRWRAWRLRWRVQVGRPD